MAKVLEGPGMGLLSKWGMAVPHYVVITEAEQLERLAQANPWLRESKLVTKAHEAIGSRMKLGLVKVGIDLDGAEKAASEMLGKEISGITISQVIISEMIDHNEEFYLAVQSTRDGAEILLASMGGIEVESNWEKVKKTSIPLGTDPTKDQLVTLAKEAGFEGGLEQNVAEFAIKLFQCYDQEDGTYLEINPLVRRDGDGELMALDAVTMVDADARFRHPDWNFSFASEFGRPYSDAEKAILEIDTRIKGSVKFIEIPGGDTALLPAGGGASVYYSDAVLAMGGTLANYAEYSGDPPDWAVEALTEKVCSLKGIKRIIVGGAIANFTNVKKTFGGIINGFRKAKSEGKMDGVQIWVRRGGPFEKEGLASMKALEKEGFDIHVYDRYTPLTDIVDYATKGVGK
ncbi:MAG: ATP citrate lyase citrate-binding domain-containing protein [Nitrospira sp.]|nr:ATP citrate lyase [Candidatus Manganitrophaceae bacterium]HIL34007.1 ATP citrate lyase [Candidatus Manganitrophaceae bacterium]